MVKNQGAGMFQDLFHVMDLDLKLGLSACMFPLPSAAQNRPGEELGFLVAAEDVPRTTGWEFIGGHRIDHSDLVCECWAEAESWVSLRGPWHCVG